MAEHAGVGKSTVFEIERGKKSVRFDRLLEVLRALNIELTWGSPLIDKYNAMNIENSSNA